MEELLREKFKKIFGINLEIFRDPLLTLFSGRKYYDIIKFDEWLIKHHSEYDIDTMSMADFIKNTYGDEALRIVKKIFVYDEVLEGKNESLQEG